MRWAQTRLSDDELDVNFLMWDIQRQIHLPALPEGETVICFIFPELKKYKSWWLIICDGKVDLCTENPGKNVDVYVNTALRSLVEIWQGKIEIRPALRDGIISVQGSRVLVKTLPDWLGICKYAHIRPDPSTIQSL